MGRDLLKFGCGTGTRGLEGGIGPTDFLERVESYPLTWQSLRRASSDARNFSSPPAAQARWPTRVGVDGTQLQDLEDAAADRPGRCLVSLIRIAAGMPASGSPRAAPRRRRRTAGTRRRASTSACWRPR